MVRKTFVRAISIPLSNIETIWRDYDAFENGLNRLTAKRFLSERSAAYMTARAAYKELWSLLDPIDRNFLPAPVTWTVKKRTPGRYF